MRAVSNREKHEGGDSVPPGWVKTTVGEIFTVLGGGTPSTAKTEFWDGSVPWITSADIDDQGKIQPRKRITEAAIAESATSRVPPGSVIVVTRVGLGKVGLAQGELCFSQDCQGLVFHDKYLFPPFVAYQMRVLVSVFKQISRGTTINGVTKKQLLDLNFSLLPYPEQHRIVAEIEKQFTRLDAGVAALERARANLKRYRASVLKAACEGRLVPTEAELARAEGRDYEPAEHLLARILKERRAKWEADQLAKTQARGKEPKDDKWKEKYQEPARPDTTDLPELPEGWGWVAVDQLTTMVTKGSSPGWQGFAYTDKGLLFLRSQNVRWGTLNLSETVRLPEDFNQTHPNSIIREGDVLLNLVGASIGRSAVATHEIDGANTNQAVGVIRIVNEGLLNKFLTYFFISPQGQNYITNTKADVARANFNLDDIRPTPVPLPPLAEQHRIVAELERRLSVIGELEAVITADLKRAERLRQSILKRAFEGKLVPQDPKDEPASVLLERIRAERQVEQKATAKAVSKPSQKSKRPQVAETQPELFR